MHGSGSGVLFSRHVSEMHGSGSGDLFARQVSEMHGSASGDLFSSSGAAKERVAAKNTNSRLAVHTKNEEALTAHQNDSRQQSEAHRKDLMNMFDWVD
jgi:hypothetical protein